jgi:anthranilate phosphoribosyltransferase
LRVDEVSPFGKTQVHSVENGTLREFEIDPADFDLGPIAPADLLGGDAAKNASILRSILDGTNRTAPRSTVLLNAAAALTVAGLAKSPAEAWPLAARSIDEGHALARLESLRQTTNS